MRHVLTIGAKEFCDGLRNRWVAASIALLTALALAVAFLGSAPVGTIKASTLSVTIAGLASLSVYLVPLIALALAYDAIVGEVERGTLLLLLAYPVARWQVVAGKFLGHMAILTLAICVGFGAAGLAAAASTDVTAQDLTALGVLIGSSVLLGAVFVALGYLISVVASEHATALGLAVGVWLFLVVLYDLALVGLLLADTEHGIGQDVLAGLLIVNPADAFRLFNLAQVDAVGAVTGLGGVGEAIALPAAAPLLSMGAWTLVVSLLAYGLFRRSEL